MDDLIVHVDLAKEGDRTEVVVKLHEKQEIMIMSVAEPMDGFYERCAVAARQSGKHTIVCPWAVAPTGYDLQQHIQELEKQVAKTFMLSLDLLTPELPRTAIEMMQSLNGKQWTPEDDVVRRNCKIRERRCAT